jgi:CubicO group peptidase (beta-lactamase class C family)
VTRGTPLRDGRPEEVGLLSERVEAARRLCADAVKKGRTPSLAVLAARRGTVVLHDAFGQQHPGPDAPPLCKDAVFPISSLSKPMTATLLMMLVEDGLVAVGRPVREYLPEIEGEHADEFIVHHLLTHTSGYDDEALVIAGLQKLGSGTAPEMPPYAHPFHHLLLATLATAPRLAPPGVEMIYGNFNYTLVGEIVKRVSGQPLEVFARERLFGPLGMRDTDYVVRDDQREKLVGRPLDAPMARVLVEGIPGLESEEWRRMPDGGGGVYSTARDIAIFGQMFLNRGTYDGTRILSRLAVEEMIRDQVPGMGVKIRNMVKRQASYGYGWLVVADEAWRYFSSALPPRGTWWHTGMGGVRLQIDPENELVTAYLEVSLEITDDLEPPTWSSDRFIDALTSAVDD